MSEEVWQEELAGAIQDMGQLQQCCSLTEDELAWSAAAETLQGSGTLRVRIPRRYLSLIDQSALRADPIRLQVIPTIEEFHELPCESSDPLAEDSWHVTPRLIRRYKSRAVFLATDMCAMYCRHCFRRRFAGKEEGPASIQETAAAANALGALPEVRELLISGGDPLTMSDALLHEMISTFQRVRPDMVIRIGTRVPVTLPSRITGELADLLHSLSRRAPVYLMTQFNHPRELDHAARTALMRLSDAGIPLFNQTVLLKGVNDDVDLLEQLMNDLVAARVKPYYLFQGDLASGTSHLRTPLATGFVLEQELRRRLSGLAMPVYAVDLPQGGGKVPLVQKSLLRKEGNRYLFRSMDGQDLWYEDVDT
ncbi:MAG: KamA family radical SAM protein [Spirochaetia bacterium]|nr:KamA family radical SAM protein [Spirochaetia bacterium]